MAQPKIKERARIIKLKAQAILLAESREVKQKAYNDICDLLDRLVEAGEGGGA